MACAIQKSNKNRVQNHERQESSQGNGAESASLQYLSTPKIRVLRTMLQFQQAQTKFHNDGIIPITAKTKTDKPPSTAAPQQS